MLHPQEVQSCGREVTAPVRLGPRSAQTQHHLLNLFPHPKRSPRCLGLGGKPKAGYLTASGTLLLTHWASNRWRFHAEEFGESSSTVSWGCLEKSAHGHGAKGGLCGLLLFSLLCIHLLGDGSVKSPVQKL